MSCCCPDDNDILMVDSDGCFNCDQLPKVKGRFGLAWVSESPDCPCPEPVGWQVEFLDTPSKVEQKCQEMVRWINCPPLPRCDPCPPDELCSPCNPPRCNPCAPKCNPCLPKCGLPKCTCKSQQQSPQQQSCCCKRKTNNNNNKKCCCSSNSRREKRNCYPPIGGPCCRGKSPRRRSPQRCCTCGNDDRDQLPKCTCDDVPVKDTNEGVIGSSSGTYKTYKNSVIYPYVPQQVILTDSYDECICSNFSANTLMIYKNNNQINTDTEYYESNDDCDCNYNQRVYNSPPSSMYQTPKYNCQVNNRKKQKDSNPNLYPDDPKQDDSGPPGRNQSNMYRDDDVRRSYYAEDENRKRTSNYSTEGDVTDTNTKKRSFMYEDGQRNNRRTSKNYYEEDERPDENQTSVNNPRSSYEYNTTERDYRNYDSDPNCCNRNTCEFYNNQQQQPQNQRQSQQYDQQRQSQQYEQPSKNRKNCREDCNKKKKNCNRDTCDYVENEEELIAIDETDDMGVPSETKPGPQDTDSPQEQDNFPTTDDEGQLPQNSRNKIRKSNNEQEPPRNHLAEATSQISGHTIPSTFKEDIIVPEKVDENKKRSISASRPSTSKSKERAKSKDKIKGDGDIKNDGDGNMKNNKDDDMKSDAIVMQMQPYKYKWMNAWAKCFKKDGKITKMDPKDSKFPDNSRENDIKK